MPLVFDPVEDGQRRAGLDAPETDGAVQRAGDDPLGVERQRGDGAPVTLERAQAPARRQGPHLAGDTRRRVIDGVEGAPPTGTTPGGGHRGTYERWGGGSPADRDHTWRGTSGDG